MSWESYCGHRKRTNYIATGKPFFSYLFWAQNVWFITLSCNICVNSSWLAQPSQCTSFSTNLRICNISWNETSTDTYIYIYISWFGCNVHPRKTAGTIQVIFKPSGFHLERSRLTDWLAMFRFSFQSNSDRFNDLRSLDYISKLLKRKNYNYLALLNVKNGNKVRCNQYFYLLQTMRYICCFFSAQFNWTDQ